jgi:hypothetical protein
MNAIIHAIDTERPTSEGNTLSVRGARIEVALKRYDGLPLGEPRDQYFVEVTAQSWDGPTKSALTAHLDADELQRLLDVAIKAGLVTVPVKGRIAELIRELNAELGRSGSGV